jgi:hypothetical protein
MGADYQTLHQLDRARRDRWRDEAHRAFRDEPRDDDRRAREKALAERCARAEQRVRDLEEAQGELLGLLDGWEAGAWRRIQQAEMTVSITRRLLDEAYSRIEALAGSLPPVGGVRRER